MFLGYSRVSTDEQANGTSLEEQKRCIQGLALVRGVGGFDVQLYEDAGVSGAIPLRFRPAGSELWAAVRPGDIVCASKLDRMFRSARDALNTYEEFKERGIDLLLYDMGSEPVTKDGGLSKVFFMMLSAFGELERDRIRERVTNGKKAKKAKGGHTGGLARMGFKVVGHGRESRIEECPEEQRMLERLEYYRGQPPCWISRKLAEQGFLNRKGNPYDKTSIRRMLASTVVEE